MAPQDSYNQLAHLASQYRKSGARWKAARFYRMAAEQAAAAYAYETAVDYYSEALALTPDANLQSRFALLLGREQLYAQLGQPDAQETDLASLSTLADMLNDEPKRATAAVRHAAYREIIGDYPAAIAIAQLSTRLAVLSGHPAAAAEGHFVWGKSLLRQSNYIAARDQLHKARQMAQETGQTHLEARCQRSLGVVAHEQGQFDLAAAQYDKALTIYRELGDRLSSCHILANLGHIDQAQSKLATARQHWEEAQELFAEIGDHEGHLRILINLGSINLDIGHYEAAKANNEKALEIARQSQIALGECFALLNLGLIAHYQDANEAAETNMVEALRVAEKLGSQRLQGHALSVYGHALVALGRHDEAQVRYWEAVAIWQELELPNLEAETKAGMARLALKRADLASAQELANDIWAQIAIDSRLGGAESPARIYLTCYQVMHQAQDRRAADVLHKADAYMQALINPVADEPSRASLRENVTANRLLLAEIG